MYILKGNTLYTMSQSDSDYLDLMALANNNPKESILKIVKLRVTEGRITFLFIFDAITMATMAQHISWSNVFPDFFKSPIIFNFM